MRGAAALGLAGCLLAAPARASLPDIAGMGVHSPALGGAGASFLTGWEASYGNPAGLIGAPRRLTVGAVLGTYRLSLDEAPYPVDDTGGLLIGATLPLPLGGFLRDRIALGFGFYLPFGVINRARIPYPDVPRAALLEARTQVVSILLGLGVRLPRGLSAGLSILALAALVGDTYLSPDPSGRITAASQSQLTVNYAPILGLRWQGLGGRLGLGAVFRAASESSFKNRVHSDLGDTLPVTLPTISIEGVGQYDPLQVALEASFLLTPRLRLAAQLGWKRWSQMPQPLLPATAGAAPLPETGYHDTAVPRAALEWRVPGTDRFPTDLRLGYLFEWSPAPPDRRPDGSEATLLDADRHVLSFGVGHHLPRLPLTLEGYVQWHQLAGAASEPRRLGGGLLLGGVTLGVDL